MYESSPDHFYARYRDSQDPDDLAESLRLAAPRLLRRAVSLVGNRTDASDLVQNTLLTALERIDELDLHAPFANWLEGILRNHVRHYFRDRQRTLGPLPADPASSDPVNPVNSVNLAMLREAVREAIDKVPAIYQQVLRLHLLDGQTPGEIAGRLSMSPSTVRTRVQRGVEKLREILPAKRVIQVLITMGVLAAKEAEAVPATRTGGGKRPPARLAALAIVVAFVAALLWSGSMLPAGEVKVDNGILASAGARPIASPTDVGSGSVRAPGAPGNPARSSLSLRLLLADTGHPASGISVRLLPKLRPIMACLTTSYRLWTESVSDEQGRVVFRDLAPGTFHLYLDDGTVRGFEHDLGPGEHVRADVRIRPVARIRGLVVTRDGSPVAGAEVWLSTTFGVGTPGYRAGTTEADGRFTVYKFAQRGCLWVKAPGYMYSTVVRLQPTLETDDVRVTLGPGGQQLEGVVRGPGGAPLARAVVGLHFRHRTRGQPMPPGTVYTLTDPDGTFAFEGLPDHEYRVSAAHPAGTTRLELVRPSAGNRVELELATGARLTGVIQPAAGQRLDDLYVTVLPKAPDPGRNNAVNALGMTQVVGAIDANGVFALEHVPSGSVTVLVFDKRQNRAVFEDEMQLVEGLSHVRHVYLDSASFVAGTVFESDGTPAVGVTVKLLPDGFQWDAEANWVAAKRTDDNGQFRFDYVQDHPYQLSAWIPTGDGERPCVWRRRVQPREKVTLSLPAGRRSPGVIRGRLPLNLSSSIRQIGLQPLAANTSWSVRVDRATGEFETKRLPPGSYHVFTSARGPASPGLDLGVVRVEPGQTVELGELEPGRATPVEVSFARRPGQASARGTFDVLDSQGVPLLGATPFRDRPRFSVFPGSYTLDVRLERGLHVRHPFTISAHEPPVRMRLAIESGTRVELVFRYEKTDPRAGAVGGMHLVVAASSGEVVEDRRLTIRASSEYRFATVLRTGEYRVRADTPWGARLETRVAVDRPGARPRVVELDLR